MPRKPRLHIPNALYHIITRGNNRQGIFRSDGDFKEFIAILQRTQTKKPFQLYAYCLMPNHLHLLIEVDAVPVSTIMQRALTTYTKYFNNKYKHRGHLFQGRYKSIICEKEAYFLELIRYIHLNPFRAKLVKKPSDWQWSGHRELMGGGEKNILEIEKVLSRFSLNKASAIKGYLEFVRDGLEMGSRKKYYPEENAPYIGDDDFIEELAVKHREMIERETPKVDLQKEGIQALLDRLSKEKGVSIESILTGGRARQTSAVRKQFIREAIGSGQTIASVARLLKCTGGYVSRIVNEQ